MPFEGDRLEREPWRGPRNNGRQAGRSSASTYWPIALRTGSSTWVRRAGRAAGSWSAAQDALAPQLAARGATVGIVAPFIGRWYFANAVAGAADALADHVAHVAQVVAVASERAAQHRVGVATRLVQELGEELDALEVRRPTLEDVYLELTDE